MASSAREELSKLVVENRTFDMDFTKRLATSETITVVNSVTSINQGRVTASTNVTLGVSVISSPSVQIPISAGTQYEQYEIVVEVATSLGHVIVGSGLLRVE